MKKFLVTLLAASFAFSSVAVAAPSRSKCPYGEVNGVCIQGTRVKSLSRADYKVVTKPCLVKKRCDFKKFYKAVPKTKARKKGFWFLAPAIETLPTVSVIVGAATIGIVSGAAGTIGSRLGDKLWPRQKALAKAGHHPQVGHHQNIRGPSNYRPNYRGWGHRPSYHPGYDAGGAIVGGIIGGAISNWFFSPEPEVVVVAPPPPPPAVPEIQPWSTEWYEYCNTKYQSFDAKSGFFTGHDGKQYFCR